MSSSHPINSRLAHPPRHTGVATLESEEAHMDSSASSAVLALQHSATPASSKTPASLFPLAYGTDALQHPLALPFTNPLRREFRVPFEQLSHLLTIDPVMLSEQQRGLPKEQTVASIEQKVVQQFACWFGGNPDTCWGYVTSGGAEGNLFGLLLAREQLPDGLVYFSEETHPGVIKNIKMLGMRSIMISTQEHGEIDYADLAASLQVNSSTPAIVLLNFGTRRSGAIDNVVRIKEILVDSEVPDYYLHANVSAGGMMLPFVDKPHPFQLSAGLTSISLSCHSLLGSPVACGVLITDRENAAVLTRAVEFVGLANPSLRSPRNPLPPLFLAFALDHLGYRGLESRSHRSLKLASILAGECKAQGLTAYRNYNGISVVIPELSRDLCKEWWLKRSRGAGICHCLPWHDETALKNMARSIATSKRRACE